MVFDRAKRFLQRHRSGLFISAAVLGTGYLAYVYLRDKLREVTESSSSERNDQEKCPPSPFPDSG
jgi:Peroxin-3